MIVIIMEKGALDRVHKVYFVHVYSNGEKNKNCLKINDFFSSVIHAFNEIVNSFALS